MRYNDFKTSGKTAIALNEAEARIQHAEDVVFWEGSAGAVRALESLRKLEKGGHNDVTIKWDGSPAIIFGRNEDGKTKGEYSPIFYRKSKLKVLMSMMRRGRKECIVF